MEDIESRGCELDSHADTCVAGNNMLLVEDTNQRVRVTGFAKGLTAKEIPVGTAVTLYTDDSGNEFHLVFPQSLYLGDKVRGSLLNPNQLRNNGLIVDDCPRQWDSQSTHSIVVPKPVDLKIPLNLRGVMSGFISRKPTMNEWADDEIPRIEMTSDLPWDPGSDEFAQAEERSVATIRRSALHGQQDQLERVVCSAQSLRVANNSVYDMIMDEDETLYDRLIAKVQVAFCDEHGDGLDGYENRDVYAMCQEPASIDSSKRKWALTPQILSRRWNIGLETAQHTMRVTTQSGIRNVYGPSERKLRQRTDFLKYPVVKGKWYTDTMFSSVQAKRLGSTAAQVYTNGKGYDSVYPIKGKQGALTAETLASFIQDVGIPQKLISDDAPELISGEFRKVVRQYHIDHKWLVPYTPWRNLAEQSIRELKKSVRSDIRRTNSPSRLWDYCIKRRAAIRRLTASQIPSLEGRTPQEMVAGSTPDISAYCMFDWYQPVYYHTPTEQFPEQKVELGRWIGIAEDVCTDFLASYVLTKNGDTVIRKSVWAVDPDELKTTEYDAKVKAFDKNIADVLGGNKNVPKAVKDADDPSSSYDPAKDLFAHGDDDYTTIPQDIEVSPPEADDMTPDALDKYLQAKVMLPQGGELKLATVIARKRDHLGQPIGRENANPILDTREYTVQYPDGSTDAFMANAIAENLYSQIDEEGRTFQILSEIVDYRRKRSAIRKGSPESFTVSSSGNKAPVPTTKGWDIKVAWKDGSTSWVPLSDIKHSNPVEVAEFAVSSKIADEPAFTWWVRKVLSKRDRIIGKVKTRYFSRTHKFGIEMPKSVKQALAIDRNTGTTLWKDAIEKEMRNVMPAFEFVNGDEIPPFYKAIECHMVFDIKMDLTRKARFVAGGHMTDPPRESTYSSVVSRDSVRLAFLIAALNDLNVLVGDVQNAYLNAPTKEKIYIKSAGPEFGPNQGRPVLIVRALYGLKSSGRMWRQEMAATLFEMGFESCKADPDVYMRKNLKPGSNFKYWEYVLVYVDDVLIVSHDPSSAMDFIKSKYVVKPSSIKEPDVYLGADVRKWKIEDAEDPEKVRWAMSSDSYVKRAIGEVEEELAKIGKALPKRTATPMAQGYRPEVDSSPELDDAQANYYQGLIGVLRWMCELGRIDILLSVALLSRFLVSPRQGHLEQVLHIFGYLKQHNHSAIVFDDTHPLFDENRFTKVDWSDTYPDAEEPIPINAPEPRGLPVSMTCFCDADHAGCLQTRRSQTGIIIFVNRSPILWYSKRQNTVESSSFGSEFVAMRTAVEMIEGLRYKLRMMGIPIDGATDVFCDNESVVKNSSRPESVLKKKHNAIAYHLCREAQAAGIIRIAWENGEYNLADLFTKPLSGPRMKQLVSRILW